VCEDIYEGHAAAFMAPLGFPEDVIKGINVKAMLMVSTLRVNENSSRTGAHRDPSCPLPALIGGSTTYELGADGEWHAAARGGLLLLIDGLFDLSYGPRDLVLLDGNYMHAVSRLRALPTAAHVRVPQLERRSFILFNVWQRKKLTKQRYDPLWDEKWRPGVPWMHYKPALFD
jgi:hypothetical protein|tara:strand:- start:1670 stop:2188 length:519 start_codon:yes stop_codon:yes gene_type:complete